MGDEADTAGLIVDEPTAPAPRWWRRHLVGVVAVVGLVLLAAWGVGYWATRPHAPDYSGKTISVTFDYDCLDGLFWKDPKTGYQWWAGDDPVLPSDFDTSAPTLEPRSSMKMHHAQGQLHFDDETKATFATETGGQLILIRQPLNQFYLTGCRGIP